MANIKATVNGEQVELSPDQLDMPEGYALVTPDNVPDGYFTQDAVNSLVKENVNKTKDKLKQDEDFKKQVLSEYNIVLGDDGKPKGLKPEVDIDEIREETAKQVANDYENKMSDLQKELEARNSSVVESAIMEAVSGNYKDELVTAPDGEKPLILSHFRDKIGVDEDGKPFVKNEDGEKLIKGDGVVRPKDYLMSEKFDHFKKDKRQRSSKFQNAENGGGIRSFSEEEIENMSDEEYEKNQDDIKKAMAEGRIN